MLTLFPLRTTLRTLIFPLALSATTLWGQVLSVTPVFPTATDTVTIVYDATQGNAALVGVSPVYAHAGLITSASTSNSNWMNVQGTWGQPTPSVLMTALGNNKHRIKYHIPTFYGAVTTGTTVQKLAFVFRNAAGTTVGRNADGSDIFYAIYPANAGALCAFMSPTGSQMVAIGTVLPLQLAANGVASWTLKDNGVVIATSSTNASTFTHNFTVGAGQHQLVATAITPMGTAADTLTVFAMPVPRIGNPPVALVDGVNYLNDSTVAVQLHAPGKQSVLVLGDFNQWLPDTSYVLVKSTNGQKWWRIFPALTPNQQYTFQYWIDGQIKIADPYSTLILDPGPDASIPAATYPNPHPYPTGKAMGHVSLIHPGKPDFIWKNTQFVGVPKEKLVIYELLIRDFMSQRNYQGLIDTLPYLKRLGITAIELMPNNEFENNESWGYNPSFHMALDKYYGTPDKYKEFIDSCHSQGIAVIMDFVFNHAFGQSPLVKMYWDATNNKPAANSPWFNAVCPHPPYCWGYDFNHASVATQNYIDRINTHWFQEFKIDGVRYDFTKGFSNVGNVGTDVARQGYLKRMADTVWGVNPNAYIILEHWGDNAEEKILADYGMLLWGNSTHNFYEGAMGFPSSSNFNWSSYKQRGWTTPGLISYLDSHDEERIMYKVKTFGRQSSATYNVRDIAIGLTRIELVSALGYLVPGPKMVYMFTELGYDQSIDNPCRVCNKPPKWSYYDVPERRRLYDVLGAIFHLKTTYPVFSTANYSTQFSGAGKVLKLTDPNDMNVIVVSNFDVYYTQVSPLFHTTGTWYDYFEGDSLMVTNVNDKLNMAPGEYRIYTTKKLATPSITLGAQEQLLSEGVVRVYPIPIADGLLRSEMQWTRPARMSQSLLDLSGRVLLTVDHGQTQGGYFSIDVSQLPTGMYLLQTNVEGQLSVQRVAVQH